MAENKVTSHAQEIEAQIRRIAHVMLKPISRFISRSVSTAVESSIRHILEQNQQSVANAMDSYSYPNIDFPALTSRHISGAKLFANREDLVRSLSNLHGGTIAELGVAMGDFSEYLLTTLAPSRFVAFDTFMLHHQEVIWGRPVDDYFHGLTHKESYTRRFADYVAPTVELVEGMSRETLPMFPDGTFDMIYIDAGHSYEEVHEDAEIAKNKIKEDGILIFNDYTMADHLTLSPYGIVPVVNQLVTEEDWLVIGFALQQHCFCDIAIQRRRHE